MKNKNKAILLIILSAFCFAMMSLFVQLSGDLPSIQKVFFRNFVALIFSFGLIIKTKSGFSFKRENLKFFILRSAFGTLGVFFNFYAIENLILSDASMIAKLAPFSVVLFSFFILKEKVKLWQVLSIVTAFIGSTFIINPSMITSIFTGNSFETSLNSVPAFIGVIGAMSAGFAYTMIRLLSNRGERGSFIVFFFSAFSSIATLPFLIASYEPMSSTQLIYLLLAGLFASFAQFSLTGAYANAPAKEISIFDYSQIVFSAILGFIVFGQVPDAFSFIGYFIIICVAGFMFYKNKKTA